MNNSSTILKVDHFVITTSNIEACLSFYKKLGFQVRQGNGKFELFAHNFKINVHILHQELLPHAQNVQVGSADYCFEIHGSLSFFKKELEKKGLIPLSDIVDRNGVKGAMKSIYLRDPDGNLVEFCSYK